jgi:SAM-dependent methyltransferase
VRALEHPEDVERLNDRLAREHPIDDYYARSPWPIRFVEARRLALIRALAGECAGRELAEIGSGGGHVLRLFPRARLTAIDVSDVFLANARRNLAGYDVRFLKGEVAALGLPDACFDAIVCTEVLEHCADPESVLREMARLLRPDGVAVVTVPNDPLILRVKALLRRSGVGWLLGARVEWGGDPFHLHRWTPAAFRVLLERHFRVTEYRAAPWRWLPVRACFRCARRAG